MVDGFNPSRKSVHFALWQCDPSVWLPGSSQLFWHVLTKFVPSTRIHTVQTHEPKKNALRPWVGILSIHVLCGLIRSPGLMMFVGLYLVGGIPTPLKNINQSVEMIIPNIWKNKKCSKPPTSTMSHTILHPHSIPCSLTNPHPLSIDRCPTVKSP